MPFVNALSTNFGFPKKITKLISYATFILHILKNSNNQKNYV
jgi:hypothetical protein